MWQLIFFAFILYVVLMTNFVDTARQSLGLKPKPTISAVEPDRVF